MAPRKKPDVTTPADKPAEAENKTPVAEEAKETPAATSSASPASDTKSTATPETRPFEILCHVRLDGKFFQPGEEIALTRAQFDALKRSQAVVGSFD